VAGSFLENKWSALFQRAIKGDADGWAEFEQWCLSLAATDQLDVDEPFFVLDLLASFSPASRRRIRGETRRKLTRPALIGLWRAARGRNPEAARLAEKAGRELGVDLRTMVNPETISNEDALAIMQAATAGGLKN
jgi:hypothetical protein